MDCQSVLADGSFDDVAIVLERTGFAKTHAECVVVSECVVASVWR